MVKIRLGGLVLRLAIGLLSLTAVAPALAQDQTHVVVSGETLFRIALRYGVDVDSLARANNIANTWRIDAGQTLVIPSGNAVDAAPAPAADSSSGATTHVVQRGENLAAIARAYGLTQEQLAQLNGLSNPNLIYAGQQLVVGGAPAGDVAAAPLESAPAPQEVAAAPAGTTYVVQRGDGLTSIANRFGVTLFDIQQANNLPNPDHIEAGQTLIIPAASLAGSAGDLGIFAGPAAPPAAVAIGRSVVVDLSDSRVYAYEDGVLVRNVLASTGLPATPTVQGDFTIYVKYQAQTMSGPGYYLPDVPYVMYFHQGYGLHGTYWHNNFGRPMSHGCVNLPTPEAEWFYHWTSVGTPVRVQY